MTLDREPLNVVDIEAIDAPDGLENGVFTILKAENLNTQINHELHICLTLRQIRQLAYWTGMIEK